MYKIKDITNKILQGDCINIMQQIPDESIDLVITSPPYDNLRDYKGYNFDFKKIAQELFRIIKIGGVVIWVVGDATINGSETGTSFRQVLYFKEIGFNLHDTMIYEKNSSPFPSTNRYYQIFEYMFIFAKDKPKTINLIRDKKNKYAGQSSWGKSSNRNKQGELIVGNKIKVKEYGIRNNIWKYNTGKGFTTKDKFAYEHPAMFPEKLAEDHIISWSNKGDLVLDPMCGSGTTCKMAKKLDRNFIGIELNPEYIKIAEKRINKISRPLSQFLRGKE